LFIFTVEIFNLYPTRKNGDGKLLPNNHLLDNIEKLLFTLKRRCILSFTSLVYGPNSPKLMQMGDREGELYM